MSYKTSLVSAVLVALSGCSASVGYSIDVTVSAPTIAVQADPAALGVQLDVVNPDGVEFAPGFLALDGSTAEQVLHFEGSEAVGSDAVACPEGPWTASLVTIADDVASPVDPAVTVEVTGACGDYTWAGTATL